MNFALTDEQEFLKEAARGALSRFKTVEAAREALDGGELPDLWPTAGEAGWPGLLISEERGGAGLGAIEAMLVFAELGRVLAGVPLLGHLPATFLLDRAGAADEALAAGETRAAYVPAKPPSDIEDSWTRRRPARLHARGPAPRIADDGTVTGEVAWVPDAPGADVLVVVGRGRPRAAVVEASRRGDVEPVARLRPHPRARPRALDGAPGTLTRASPEGAAAAAWYLAQALLAAESLGAVEVALEVSVAVRQGALHVRPRDRLLPGGQARARGGAAAARERPLAHVLRGLGGPGQARRVPARRVGVPARGRPGARARVARADLRARRHRRDVGARRAAVLPPRAALAAAAGRHGRRRRPGGRRAAWRSAGSRLPSRSSTRS